MACLAGFLLGLAELGCAEECWWLRLAGAELSKRMTMAYRLRQETCRCTAVPEWTVRVQYSWHMRYNAPSRGHEVRVGRGNAGRGMAVTWHTR